MVSCRSPVSMRFPSFFKLGKYHCSCHTPHPGDVFGGGLSGSIQTPHRSQPPSYSLETCDPTASKESRPLRKLHGPTVIIFVAFPHSVVQIVSPVQKLDPAKIPPLPSDTFMAHNKVSQLSVMVVVEAMLLRSAF